MITRVVAVLVALLIALCIQESAASGKDVTDTDICKVVANAAAFDGKVVRVRAKVIQDIEGTTLVDEDFEDDHYPGLDRPSTLRPKSSCKQGISLRHEIFGDKDPGIEKLSELLKSRKPLSATFVGKVHSRDLGYVRNEKGRVVGMRGLHNIGVDLVVRSVSDIVVGAQR